MSRFRVGLTYEVGTTVANYLLAEGPATPSEEVAPALVVPIQDVAQVLFPDGGMKAEAADRPPRKNRRKSQSDNS